MAAKGKSGATPPLRYTEGASQNDWKLEVLNHNLLPKEEVYEEIPSVKAAAVAIREKKVPGGDVAKLVAMLAFAVELSQLQPHPNPMNTAWLTEFIQEKIGHLKLAQPEDKVFAQQMDDFHDRISRHIGTMDIGRGKQMKMLRDIVRTAEQELQK